jgi:DNA-binding NtrC family response regulator
VLVATGPWLANKDLSLSERCTSRATTAQRNGHTLPPAKTSPETSPPDPGSEPAEIDAGEAGEPKDGLNGVERLRIARALVECGGNQRRAALSLGISRRTLVRKIARLGLPRPRESDW